MTIDNSYGRLGEDLTDFSDQIQPEDLPSPKFLLEEMDDYGDREFKIFDHSHITLVQDPPEQAITDGFKHLNKRRESSGIKSYVKMNSREKYESLLQGLI